jgi:hypothetical protein
MISSVSTIQKIAQWANLRSCAKTARHFGRPAILKNQSFSSLKKNSCSFWVNYQYYFPNFYLIILDSIESIRFYQKIDQ